MTDNIKIDWLLPAAERWSQQASQGRTPHALLVTGLPGVGKRAFAAWVAEQRYGGLPPDDPPRTPFALREHPDLHWICPPSDKNSIGIEQVRDLAADLALTSHAGGGKMAVIEPADAMTHSAANGLLKTLEEPAGDALLILLVDRNGGLPATIVSRCQRLDIRIPSRDVALQWLQKTDANEDWAELLGLVGGAPIAALGARERIQHAHSMANELATLATGKTSPIDVAARWSKLDTTFVLDWLARTVQAVIRRHLGVSEQNRLRSLPDNVLTRMDRRDLFCYLDTIGTLQRQPAGSYNPQLALESLLIDWASGLRHYRSHLGSGDRLPDMADG